MATSGPEFLPADDDFFFRDVAVFTFPGDAHGVDVSNTSSSYVSSSLSPLFDEEDGGIVCSNGGTPAATAGISLVLVDTSDSVAGGVDATVVMWDMGTRSATSAGCVDIGVEFFVFVTIVVGGGVTRNVLGCDCSCDCCCC